MSAQLHPNGFRISDRPVAASFAHPYSFQPIPDYSLRDDACLMSTNTLGGMEGVWVRYWDEASTAAVMEFAVEEQAPSAGAALAVETSIPLTRSASQSSSIRSRYLLPGIAPGAAQVVRTKREVKRGEMFAMLCGGLIAFAWILFMGTAWLRLRSKEERGASIHH